MTALIQEAQSSSPSPFISLFILDASAIGGGILRWASSAEEDGSNIKYNGTEYPPLNFAVEGFAWDGDTPPRPKITASIAGDSNLSSRFLDMAVGYKGGQGAILYRIRTLARFLDGHEDAGAGIEFPRDMYIVDRIIALTKSSIQWELLSPLDLPNCKLPSRQALRDSCPWIYRHWNSDSNQFEYVSTGTQGCPYTGNSYFTKAGSATTADKDECGRHLSDCVLRFGSQPLPYGGFPGLKRGNI